MKKKVWIAILIIVTVGGLVGFNIWKEVMAEGPVVKTTKLKERTFTTRVMTPGTLKLKNEQTVYVSPEKGEVEQILVKEGDKVKKGDVLLRYTNEQLQLEKEQNALSIESGQLKIDNLNNQRSDLNEKERELARQVGQQEASRTIAKERNQLDLEKRMAELELKQAELQKETIEKQLDALSVKSEVDGTVLVVNEEAAHAANGAEPQPVIRVADMNQLIVEGAISEYDTLKVKNGQPVVLRSDVFPDKEWRGKVSHIGFLPERDALGGMEQGEEVVQYAVEVTVEDKNIPLKPGFQMIMEIETERRTVQVLPAKALISGEKEEGKDGIKVSVHQGDKQQASEKGAKNDKDSQTAYVYVVKNGKVERREVKTGIEQDNWVEIVAGLKPGDRVVVNPSDDLQDGAEVNVQ